MLYQLSYSRVRLHFNAACLVRLVQSGIGVKPGGRDVRWWGEDSNLRRLSRQIYSLVPLATRVPHRQGYLLRFIFSVNRVHRRRSLLFFTLSHYKSWRQDLNLQPTAYKAVALPIELRQHLDGRRLFTPRTSGENPPAGADRYRPRQAVSSEFGCFGPEKIAASYAPSTKLRSFSSRPWGRHFGQGHRSRRLRKA